MDREGLRRQLEHALAVRAEKLGAMESARRDASGAADDRARVNRLQREIQRSDDRVAGLKNALAALDHIGEQTTHYYVSKRRPSRT